ncbi:MAG: HD domain-containing protein [Acidobacteriota bacterium]|nr:HD domain-containing protein [Acidobacteriota bacterium]MDH3528776.1 HD domain-containing protein [Acidobacteriota bacterium]
MIEPTDASVLVCDPHEKNRTTIVKFLSANYACKAAASFTEASELVARGNFAAMVLDSGDAESEDFISTAQFLAPETSLIVTSANESSRFVVDAFRAGVFDVLLKPFELEELEESVVRAIAKAESARSRVDYYDRLEAELIDGAAHLEQAIMGIESSYGMTLKALIQALETRDAETHGHSERVVTFSLRLAHEVGLDKDQKRDLELGAMLHDIGKIGVPDAILRKPAKLNKREWDKMKLHPVQGHRILRSIPFLDGAATVVLQHHERWDGAGYPHQLRGDKIDITARVFAVADAFDAMTSDRVYSKGRTFEDAYKELQRCAGSQFDPGVIEAFNAVPASDWEILHERSLQEKKESKSFQAVVEDLVRSHSHFEMVH